MSRRVRSTLVGALLASWAIVVTLVASSLLARHLLPLPASDAGPLRSELAALRAPNETGFTVFHVLYAECRCSRRVAESLASSVRPPGVVEHVLLVDDEGGATRALLQNRGFVLHDVASTDLAPRFGVTSAPSFIVASPDGQVRYAGGYTDRKQSLASHDREVIAAVMSGRSPDPLPIYGCAVAQNLKKERNPFALP